MQSFYAWLKRIKSFIFNISTRDKLLFMEAFFLTGVYRFKILRVPFNKLKLELGSYNVESDDDVDVEYYRLCRKIGRIVTSVSKYTPWESLCLVKAMTVQKMLKKRGVCTTVYLGVNKDTKDNMNAHAWIRCGKMYITGGNGSGYATVAKFTNI